MCFCLLCCPLIILIDCYMYKSGVNSALLFFHAGSARFLFFFAQVNVYPVSMMLLFFFKYIPHIRVQQWTDLLCDLSVLHSSRQGW